MGLLGPKIFITSDYSGIRCWEQAWEAMVAQAMKKGSFTVHPLIYHRACDIDAAVQGVLLGWQQPQSAPQHIFGDINDYVAS
eukprot:10634411-Alexandrium_andersonii.AAC.1